MHKENCTVGFVMSGRGLNMSVVIYNSGLLSTSTAPGPRDPKGRGRVVWRRRQNRTAACDVVHAGKRGRGLFIRALLGCSGDAEATFREM